MRVVIVGAGGIARQLADNLSQRGHNELVIIDSDEETVETFAADFDALAIHGDATDPDILKQGQIEDADALVATTDSDAINTVIAMLGRRFGVEQVIVKLEGFGLRAACREIGVSDIIAPTIAAAAKIQAALYGSEQLDFSLAAQGGLKLVELETSGAVGKTIAELGAPEEVLFVAVLRGDETFIPRQNTTLEEEDVLLTFAESEEALARVREGLEPSPDPPNG